MNPAAPFAPRKTIEQVEEGHELAPKFDSQDLITAVTTDYGSGELLMVGYMNAEALSRTIETGEAHYFSRSRQALWHKGATSGLVQRVRELLIDDASRKGFIDGRTARLPTVIVRPGRPNLAASSFCSGL